LSTAEFFVFIYTYEKSCLWVCFSISLCVHFPDRLLNHANHLDQTLNEEVYKCRDGQYQQSKKNFISNLLSKVKSFKLIESVT